MRPLPTFETRRLIIRPRTPDDLDACLDMDRDPEVVRFVAPPWSNDEEHRAFVLKSFAASYPEGMGYWSVAAKSAPNTFLGWIILVPVDGTGPEIEVGWRFVRAAWGRGYATEAAGPILDHGFETLGLESIVSDIHPLNDASVRVAEKIGMSFVGERQRRGITTKAFALTGETYRRS
jgi:RimJ/RimL family protein N-acetyltransferase